MRYAVLSDIHSNAEALEAVLRVCDRELPDAFLCVGDLVGYGPDPSTVIAEVRRRKMITVRGNHDQAAFDPGEDQYFNDWAREGIAWTRERLSDAELQYLEGLDLTREADGALLVHASPSAPHLWRYILSASEAGPEFSSFDESVCFIGHSHVPMVIARGESGVEELKAAEVSFEAGKRYIVNVGSVGQPRDGDPRAALGLFDSGERTFRLVRVKYDAEATSRKIIDSGLPPFLGERLLAGR
jgi:diadenosine tetraphosphatase ApaH/serine/threonine PP2A family protein phosphatase